MKERIDELKKTVFYEMMDIAGRVFIVAKYSDNLVIGNRGLTDDEMKNGIVLVFNQRMNFSWDDYGISATLVFSTSPQKCFIPADDIVAIYSPELNSQFLAAPQTPDVKPDKDEPEDQLKKEDEKVVRVDFSKKKQRGGKTHGS